jgi:hypothetical protein
MTESGRFEPCPTPTVWPPEFVLCPLMLPKERIDGLFAALQPCDLVPMACQGWIARCIAPVVHHTKIKRRHCIASLRRNPPKERRTPLIRGAVPVIADENQASRGTPSVSDVGFGIAMISSPRQ